MKEQFLQGIAKTRDSPPVLSSRNPIEYVCLITNEPCITRVGHCFLCDIYKNRFQQVKCSRCGETDWIDYPLIDKQCRNCGHFQKE